MMTKTEKQSLLETYQHCFEVKKHSALAQMNNVTSLMQRKAINAFLSIARDQLKRNAKATVFEVDLGVLKAIA